MAYSKIKIAFQGVPNIDEHLKILESTWGVLIEEKFVKKRLASNQVTIPPRNSTYKSYDWDLAGLSEDTFATLNYNDPYGQPRTINGYVGDIGTSHPFDALDGDYNYSHGSVTQNGTTSRESYSSFTSTSYKNAFALDYNTTSRFSVEEIYGADGSGMGTVIITANYSNAKFSIVENTGPITTEIVNEEIVPEFSIDLVKFSKESGEESNKCLVNLTTNHPATKLIEPIARSGNTENPLVFSSNRAMSFTVEVEDAQGLRATKKITTPQYLIINNFTLNVNNSPSGGTIAVSNVNSDGLELKYSLDGSTWQDSNIFSGLEVGTYIFWVKDQLGDVKNKSFEVSEDGIYYPYFYISKSNSFRFAKRVVWGNSDYYKNDENTLSHESDSKIPYTEIQQFQSEDVITTQFKSNFDSIKASIIKSDLKEVNVPVKKMTSNIGIKDKRDAFKYNIGRGKTGVYFISGNIYDYNTGGIIEPYFLNGLLPEWAKVGGYIQISNSWFLISEIVYDEAKNAEVIVFTNSYTGLEAAEIVGSVFNRFDFEVYEFKINMSSYIDSYFSVRINNSDDKFDEIVCLSELIYCKIKHDDLLEIKYSNSTNTDVFYSTGISNLIRVPYTIIKGKISEENETHKTDTTTILLNSDVYEVDEFVFEPVTKEIWRKLSQALSHELITINGIGYVKSGDLNTEGPLEESNLYVLTATMIKTGVVYNSISNENVDFDMLSEEFTGLMSSDGGFVSY
jgi:hypothetical protein